MKEVGSVGYNFIPSPMLDAEKPCGFCYIYSFLASTIHEVVSLRAFDNRSETDKQQVTKNWKFRLHFDIFTHVAISVSP